MNLLPSQSMTRVYGHLTTVDGKETKNTSLVNCAIRHLLEDIRYELNAVEIDRCKNVGITSVMKGWVSYTPSQQKTLHAAGFATKEEPVLIPLSMIFGFAEDYRKIVFNMKHELILTRSRTDLNAVIQKKGVGEDNFETFKIDLLKIK